LCEPSEKREEIRFADLTGADNIFSNALVAEQKRRILVEGRGGEEGVVREKRKCAEHLGVQEKATRVSVGSFWVERVDQVRAGAEHKRGVMSSLATHGKRNGGGRMMELRAARS
jgi:hypothetical protein